MHCFRSDSNSNTLIHPARSRLALEREVRTGVEAATHAARADAAALEKTNQAVQNLQRGCAELESEITEQQSSMHVMMDVLDG